MKKCYVSKTFRKQALIGISMTNRIIREYQRQGYDLTLRQLYYQFVARGFLKNNDRNYNWLGNLVNEGRMAGLIDWSAIQDRSRFIRKLQHWRSPKDIILAAASSYRIWRWKNQPFYVEVWVEKDALIDIVEKACRPLDVTCFSCRGYVSQTAMRQAALRFRRMEKNEKETILIHLGDHDPSGVDMTRDIQDRLAIFGSRVRVERVALTSWQIKQFNPPPNPAKIKDSRSTEYIRKFGNLSWELDALSPPVLAKLIRRKVSAYIDVKKMEAAKEKEREAKNMIKAMAEQLSTSPLP